MDALEQAETLPAHDLFAWAESLARSRDPETSKQGAEGIQKQLGGMHHTFLRCLRELGQASANEVAERCTSNFAKRNTFRRRASDLVSDKFGAPRIRIVGTRICSVSGKNATVYAIREDNDS
jgi:hypothetical protein